MADVTPLTREQIDRINELGRKASTPAGLTPEEKEEQATLRALYLAWFRASLRGNGKEEQEG